jgi:uncharacterized membrane protein SirB2
MNLAAWYPALKTAHVTLVLSSGLLFALRGGAHLRGRTWPRSALARRSSVVIDTLLLACGATLWLLLGLNPLRDAWFGVKLLGMLGYIVLGSLALKRARTARGRLLAYAAALLMFGFVLSVARAHHPAGPWRLLDLTS